jgi:hypothetical protein
LIAKDSNMSAVFARIASQTAPQAMAAVQTYRGLTSALSEFTQKVVSGEGYFHETSRSLMAGDIKNAYQAFKDLPFVKTWDAFLRTHVDAARVWASYVHDEPVPKHALEGEVQRRQFVAQALGYENGTPEAEQARKMALSPLLGLTPALILHQTVFGQKKALTPESQNILSAFDGWEGMQAEQVVDTYRQVTREQRVGPKGLVAVPPLSADDAKETFSKLGIDLARLHLARIPRTPENQREAIKLICAAWDVDATLAQDHVKSLNAPELTTLAKQTMLDWDIVNAKRFQPTTLRSEFEAHHSMNPLAPRKPAY